MNFNPNKHRRSSIRLNGYDYSKSGLYFVTICVLGNEKSFGKISNGKMILNHAGNIANDQWSLMSEKYNQIQIHDFVVMPNHVHSIIQIINEDENAEIVTNKNDSESSNIIISKDQRRLMLIPKVIGWYKMNTAKKINCLDQKAGVQFWQASYYDHIIRNEDSYRNISNYIKTNPSNWKEDKFFEF